MRTAITSAIFRVILWHAQKGDCFLCGKPLPDLDETPEDIDESISIEHLQPRSKGGRDRLMNYALSHKACNHKRGNDLLTREQEFKAAELQFEVSEIIADAGLRIEYPSEDSKAA